MARIQPNSKREPIFEQTRDQSGLGFKVQFDSIATADTVRGRRYPTGPDGTDGIQEENVSNYRFVIDVDSLSTGPDNQISLNVSTLDGVSDPTQVTIYKRPTPGQGSFSALPTSYDSAKNELMAPVEEFSEFVLASDSEPLPVEIAVFEGTATERGIRLTWQTTSETNNSGFDVQRRAEGSSWTTVGFVEGAGTTSEPQSYRFTDSDLPYDANRLSYRLKQIDNDGTTVLSDPVVVEHSVSEVELLGTFPNPASQQATVRFALPGRQEVEIRLYDALGRQVHTVINAQKEGRHEATIDVSGLSSGTYFLRLQAEGQTKTQQLTVTR